MIKHRNLNYNNVHVSYRSEILVKYNSYIGIGTKSNKFNA